MTPVVNLRDVVEELSTLSDELQAYLNRKTGKLITVSSEELEAMGAIVDLDSYSDWEREAIQEVQGILHTDDYLLLPSSFEIDEYSIMERFCHTIENAKLSNDLLSQIRGSGAFRRFKQTIDRYDMVEDWYRYKQKVLKEIAIDWLEANSISYQTNEE